jgi:subtilase family serine protease
MTSKDQTIHRCGHKGLEDGMHSETLRRDNVTGVTSSSWLAACVLSIVSIIPLAHAQTTNLVLAPVDPGNRVMLKGHHPGWASAQNDAGAVSSDLALERLTIVLNRPPEVEAAFKQFLADQQNPQSQNYHHWLTPVEIGKRFGVSDHDITAVKGWLGSQNLTADSVSDSRVRISFSGTAANVGRAFGSEMRYFTVRSEKRISIAGEAQIPAELSGVIKSISGLYTLKLEPQHRLRSDIRVNPEGSFTCSGVPCNIIFPGDFATIYNAGSGGVDGTGQTIAIIGRSQVCTSDITGFAGLAAVTINGPHLVVPTTGSQPAAAVCTGSTSSDQDEATLDVTRSGSVAQGATIDLVASGGSATGDGVDVATQYVVDTPSIGANIMSISFGGCEADFGLTGVMFYDDLFQQAAGQGISVFVSSGDSGAAGCDASFNPPPPSQQLSPNALCASSYATCVGGTEFADTANPSLYWSSTNGTGFSSALSYIPEGAWNEPGTAGAFVVAATGGGVSGFIPTPSWQTGTGVPVGRTGRYTPDVSFSAAGHDGYFACLAAGSACSLQTGVGAVVFSGTSASAPDMAGITALLNQSRGSAEGLLNPDLYGLAATPANGVFHDVTVASSAVTGCLVTKPSMCNNSTPTPAGINPGFSGYLVTAGYDEATGLGSLNVGNLLSSWPAATQTTVQSSASPALPGTSVTFTATVAATSGTPTGNVTFMDGGTSLSTMTLTNGTAAFTTSSLAFGFHPITAVYAGNALAFAASKSQILQQAVGTLSTTSLQTSALQVGAGTSVTFTAVVAPQSGTGTPTGMVAFMDLTTSLGTAALTSGTAVLSTSTLAAGTHSVTAVYQGDTTFLQSTSSPVPQSVVDIKVAATPSSLSVVAGANGSVSVAITPTTGFLPTVTVTCAGAPSESMCTVGTGSTSGGVQTFAVSITTTAPHSLRQITPMGMFVPFGLLLPLGGMFLAVTGKRTRRNLGWLGLTLLLTMSTLWLSACGGSSKKDPGTPPGTYNLTVTTTANSGAITINKPTTVMLTVTAQ